MKRYYILVLLLMSFLADAQNVAFEDVAFKNYIVNSTTTNGRARDFNNNMIAVDANADGEIQLTEAAQVGGLWITYVWSFTSIVGIKDFVNLQVISVYSTSVTAIDVSNMTTLTGLYITESDELLSINASGCTSIVNITAKESALINLQVSGCTSLKILWAQDNQLPSITFNEVPMLEDLNLDNSQLTSIDLSQIPSLKKLSISGNALTSLDLSANIQFQELIANDNLLTSIAFGNPAGLKRLSCNQNQLSDLQFLQMTALEYLNCQSNQFKYINLKNCDDLLGVRCQNNKLSTLIVRNLQNENFIEFCGNPALKHICADDYDINDINAQIATCGIVGCLVTQNCSLLPGQDDFEIVGATKLDLGSNGCDVADAGFSNMRFQSFSGSTSAYLFANQAGEFSAFVPPGTFGIVPAFEVPGYFTATPSLSNISFPGTPPALSFCVVPNGVHPDLDITILPLVPARPGFASEYKIIYRNKGNQIQSGTVTFLYDDSRLDFTQAIPTANVQSTGFLEWNYANILPGESREIYVSMMVNAPTDTPPVNFGDELPFSAAVNPIPSDDTPADNSFGFKQIVVNPFDPNNITCLEGDVVGMEVVGNYVHYLIRFENLGTAPAQNVTVTDIIDPSRFDINSLIPLSGSHLFETRILDDENQVVFYFEDINLPFEDGTNDGHIAFKVKTKPTLIVGDVFSNTAMIYFDFNFPVVTNTASTTIQLLGTPDSSQHSYTVYPNPVNSELNIVPHEGVVIESVWIYNLLGQLVLTVIAPEQPIDVTELLPGTYFLKSTSELGIGVTKFIKN